MTHLEANAILSDAQHGFRKGRSRETQLLLLLENLTKTLDNRRQVDLILTDFSKAFDKVPHQRLLLKLKNFGVQGPILDWLTCFVTKRTQRVVLEGIKSEEVIVNSGVPQGTVLGPLLFLVFINDIHENVSSQLHLFADDCILYREVISIEDCNNLQRDISSICDWESEWQLEFNAVKYFALRMSHKKRILNVIYKMKGTPLDTVPKHQHLGVTITEKLDWSPHCNTIASKANRTLGVLRRHLKGCSKSVKSTAYKALVRPQLEYCSSVWDPYHQTDKATLERVQRRAARLVTGDYKRESSVTTLINNLGWKTLEERRVASRLTLMYKIINKLVDVDIKNTPLQLLNTQTRRSLPLTYQNLRPNKNCYKYSFFSHTIPEWNSLPVSVRTSNSLNIFKSELNNLNLLDLIAISHYHD